MRERVKTIKSNKELIGKEIKVKGWVRTVRAQKSFSFIEINDGSSLSNLQIIADGALPIENISNGCAISVEGTVVESPGGKQSVEIQASSINLIGKCCAEEYPLQKKRHSFEFLRSIAHLRPRTNTMGAVTRVRNHITYATHNFFQKRNFLHVHTPIITLSDCEGAGELFQVTTLNHNADADHTKDFFGKKAYLTVSGQLNGEIYASAFSDIYTFGPTFRAENSNTSRHLAEFWMIEPEIAFADLNDDMDLAEAYLKEIFQTLLETCSEDMEFFDRFICKGVKQRLETVVNTPFKRITYTQAVDLLINADKKFEFPIKWGSDLQSEHERYLCEEHFNGPLIVYNYPLSIKPFYMKVNDDNKTVANMDVLVPGVGEIIGGSQREDRLDTLATRMDEQDMDKQEYWWYLELRKYGSVPHAGFGAGLERLILFATGMENIRDVIAFPRYPGHATF